MDSKARAKNVELLIFDVDGVLTGGQLFFGPDGEMLKAFHVHDGLGIAAAHKAGLKTAIITARESEMVRKRVAELKISDLCQGAANKLAAFDGLKEKYNLTANQIAYVGDDLNDLPLLTRVGLACAVGNAVPEVRAAAHYVASREGGRGGVREIIEFILKAQEKWETVVAAYTKGVKEVRQ
ncbi:3-deoxy-d-manno-octulosonate 8-phosphate phosphatase [Lucifera butyrica]|uniref:3-deoxy-d-manno-octulosonate 8-phosphate phosphatase n=1 Tax=Lucifera butyrica TaxID=1351585 RepID=A0A498RD91_9FIRM|nr:HAD-IIIA family hydrolase [Lucifera butyrica]VBB09279.1 3-deoxy-d-manno-octulosonate 8-phosphate phosphatase [Lucifera butyrica]